MSVDIAHQLRILGDAFDQLVDDIELAEVFERSGDRPPDPTPAYVPAPAQRPRRRRRAAALLIVATVVVIGASWWVRFDNHQTGPRVGAADVSAPPTADPATPPPTTVAAPLPSTLPGGVSLAQLPTSTPHAGVQDWDATLPSGEVRFSCIYQFGSVQFSVSGGVVHREAAGAALPGWSVTSTGDNDNVFTDGTSVVDVSGSLTPDASGSRCRLTVTSAPSTATSSAPTTRAATTEPVSLDTLPPGTNGAVRDQDLGNGNVAFTCNYGFGWAYFGANETSMAFLSAVPSAPGWHVSLEPFTDTPPLHRTVIFSNGTETVVVTGTAQPDASGSRCDAQLQSPDRTVAAPGT